MKRKTIRHHSEFFSAPGDIRVSVPCFKINARWSREGCDARYGVVASKKTFKLAVERNRAKRILRNLVAFNEEFLQDDMDYIFIATQETLSCDFDEAKNVMMEMLVKISKICKKNDKKS